MPESGATYDPQAGDTIRAADVTLREGLLTSGTSRYLTGLDLSYVGLAAQLTAGYVWIAGIGLSKFGSPVSKTLVANQTNYLYADGQGNIILNQSGTQPANTVLLYTIPTNGTGPTGTIIDARDATLVITVGHKAVAYEATDATDSKPGRLTRKDYVDAQVAASGNLKTVRLASTGSNIALTGTYTLDGKAIVAGDRIFPKNQTDQTQNGVWVAAAGAWARASDFLAVAAGCKVTVQEGNANAETTWALATDGLIVIGITSLAFVLDSVQGQRGTTNGLATLTGGVHTASERPYATDSVRGDVTLSVAPVLGTAPIAVGDNDGRMTDSRVPMGSAGGDLTGTYPNPTIAPGAVTPSKLSFTPVKAGDPAGGALTGFYPNPSIAAGVVTPTMLSFTPVKSGDAAGGDLVGTYPNPTIAPGAVTPSKLSFTPVKAGDAASGDLTGTYPSPTIAALAVTDAKVAAANKDGTSGTPSMRTLGFTGNKAMPGTATLDQISAPVAVVSMNNQRLADVGTPVNGADGTRLLDIGGQALVREWLIGSPGPRGKSLAATSGNGPMAFGRAGNVIVVAYNDGTTLKVALSTDSGYSLAALTSPGSITAGGGPQQMSVFVQDASNFAIAYNNGTSLVFSATSNGGSSWTTNSSTATTSLNPTGCSAVCLSLTSAFYSYSVSTTSIGYAMTTNAGGAFTKGTVATETVNNVSPGLATADGTTVYVFWGTSANKLRWSKTANAGAAWGAAADAATDAAGTVAIVALAVSSTVVVVDYVTNAATPNHKALRTVNGTSFGVSLDLAGKLGHLAVATEPATLGHDGATFHHIYQTGSIAAGTSGTYNLHHAYSADDGATWSVRSSIYGPSGVAVISGNPTNFTHNSGIMLATADFLLLGRSIGSTLPSILEVPRRAQ